MGVFQVLLHSLLHSLLDTLLQSLLQSLLHTRTGNREGNAVKEMNSCKLMIRGVAKALGTAVEKGYDGEDMVAMRDSAHRLLDTVTAFIDEHKDSAN